MVTPLQKINSEANAELALTLRKMIEAISIDFKKSMGDDCIEVDIESTWTLHPEWRSIYYMGRYEPLKALHLACTKTKETIIDNNFLDFLEGAIIDVFTNRNCAIRYLEKREPDYASAMEHAFHMAKAQGCIAASRNLAIAENYFRHFGQGTIKKAKLESDDYKKLGSIFMEIAKKKLDSCRTMTELLGTIAHEFYSEWLSEYEEFPPSWNPDNFPRYIETLRKKNPDFASTYADIKVQLRESKKKKRLTEKMREMDRKRAVRI